MASCVACLQLLLEWLDPHGYHRRVPLLQSAPEALAAMARYARAAHAPMRAHANDVSAATAAVVGAPASAGARRILFRGQQYEHHTLRICDCIPPRAVCCHKSVQQAARPLCSVQPSSKYMCSTMSALCRLNLFGRAEQSYDRPQVAPKQFSELRQDGVSKHLSHDTRHALLLATMKPKRAALR